MVAVANSNIIAALQHRQPDDLADASDILFMCNLFFII